MEDTDSGIPSHTVACVPIPHSSNKYTAKYNPDYDKLCALFCRSREMYTKALNGTIKVYGIDIPYLNVIRRGGGYVE